MLSEETLGKLFLPLISGENFIDKTSEQFSTTCRDTTDMKGDNTYFTKAFRSIKKNFL